MNKVETIIKLAEMGYNKDEISKLLEEQEKAPEPAPEPAPETEEVKDEEKDQPQKVVNVVDDFTAKFNEAMNNFNEVMDKKINDLQKLNILNSQMGTKAPETAEDMLAKVINPYSYNVEEEQK